MSQAVKSVSQRSLSDFERKTTALITLLTRRGDDLLSAMTAAASESARRVANLSGDVDTSADRTAASLREIERKFSALVAMIEKRGDDVTAMVSRRLAARPEGGATSQDPALEPKAEAPPQQEATAAQASPPD